MLSILDRIFTPVIRWIWNLLGFETQEGKFERIERHLLRSCKRFCKETFIEVEKDLLVRTVVFNPGLSNRRPPLVLLHGVDSGLCFWLQSVKKLSKDGTVYAIDLPGFGRSFKPKISANEQDVEGNYVHWLERWRRRVGIEKFFLLGHDFGGYIATLYTMAHPSRVCHLILYEPWGFPILPFGLTDRSPRKKSTVDSMKMFPSWISQLDSLLHFLRRMSFLYKPVWFSCLQIQLFAKIVLHPLRSLKGFYQQQDPFSQYEALCKQVQTASGKIAYHKLSVLNIWARDPLIKRIPSLDSHVFITFVFGSKSWFDHRSAYEVKCSRSDQDSVSVHVIETEGNRAVHLEKSREFESIISHKLQSYEDEHDEGWIEDDWICCDNSEDETVL